MATATSGSRIVIIADDLTGALDSAAPFATRGLATRVVLNPDHLPDHWPAGINVLGVSTNSREQRQAEAVVAVHKAAERLANLAPTLVFKKIDSRLKGHIAAEIRTCLDVFAFEKALVAPAIPGFGRVTQGGLLSGEGIHTPISVAERCGRGHILPDVASDADFVEPVRVILSGPNLAVGAKGLAEALAGHFSREVGTLQRPLRPALFAIGSVDPITRAQLRHLQEAAQINPAVAETIEVLFSPDLAGPIQLECAQKFADTIAARIRRRPPRTLFVTGGETARHVLRQLDVFELIVQGEVLPGIPQTIANVGGRQITVLTKSGGFGDSATLASLLKRTEVGHDAYF